MSDKLKKIAETTKIEEWEIFGRKTTVIKGVVILDGSYIFNKNKEVKEDEG